MLPIGEKLASMLSGWRSSSGSPAAAKAVFPWPYDTHGPFYDDWNEILKAANLPDGKRYTPKDCRSSCASALIAGGVPTVVVKDFLGHASVSTTENYYVNTEPAMRAVAEAREVRSPEPDDQGTSGKNM